jgi:hypothetical protein
MRNDLEFQFHIAALDSLGLPLLVFNAATEPIFLSAAAAQLLSLRNRSELGQYAAELAPVAELVKNFRAAANSHISDSRQRVEELQLRTCDARQVSVLALARDVELLDGNRPLSATVVIFYDLLRFAPFLLALEQSRKVRPTLILASAVMGRALSEVSAEDLLRISQAAEQESARESARQSESRLQPGADATDLQASLTLALDIVDRLVPPDFRISMEVTTSALLALPRTVFLRILCHLLIEGGDFSGAYGKARISAVIRRAEANADSRKNASTVQLLILAQRVEPPAIESHPLELYLFRKSTPSRYRITRARSESAGTQHLTPEEQAFLEKHLGREPLQRIPLTVSSVPEEVYTENLRIAAHLAKSARAMLDVKLLSAQHLALSLSLPLVGGGSNEQNRTTSL